MTQCLKIVVIPQGTKHEISIRTGLPVEEIFLFDEKDEKLRLVIRLKDNEYRLLSINLSDTEKSIISPRIFDEIIQKGY